MVRELGAAITALKPIENRRVVGVKDGQMKMLRKLLINPVCAHPECSEPTGDGGHHIFPRSLITNDSWFVEIESPDGVEVVPHVTGLCREHHEAVEIHTAWIKYEDGKYVWYDVIGQREWMFSSTEIATLLIGPLDPQPGQVEHRKKRKRKQGEARRARRTISIAVPQDEQEQGAGVLDDLIQVGREEWAEQLGWSETVPAYFVIVAAFAKAFQT